MTEGINLPESCLDWYPDTLEDVLEREHFWGGFQHFLWEEKQVGGKAGGEDKGIRRGGQTGSRWNTSDSPCARLNLFAFAVLVACSPFPAQQLESYF